VEAGIKSARAGLGAETETGRTVKKTRIAGGVGQEHLQIHLKSMEERF
jgi:hypothetical protein